MVRKDLLDLWTSWTSWGWRRSETWQGKLRNGVRALFQGSGHRSGIDGTARVLRSRAKTVAKMTDVETQEPEVVENLVGNGIVVR